MALGPVIGLSIMVESLDNLLSDEVTSSLQRFEVNSLRFRFSKLRITGSNTLTFFFTKIQPFCCNTVCIENNTNLVLELITSIIQFFNFLPIFQIGTLNALSLTDKDRLDTVRIINHRYDDKQPEKTLMSVLLDVVLPGHTFSTSKPFKGDILNKIRERYHDDGARKIYYERVVDIILPGPLDEEAYRIRITKSKKAALLYFYTRTALSHEVDKVGLNYLLVGQRNEIINLDDDALRAYLQINSFKPSPKIHRKQQLEEILYIIFRFGNEENSYGKFAKACFGPDHGFVTQYTDGRHDINGQREELVRFIKAKGNNDFYIKSALLGFDMNYDLRARIRFVLIGFFFQNRGFLVPDHTIIEFSRISSMNDYDQMATDMDIFTENATMNPPHPIEHSESDDE